MKELEQEIKEAKPINMKEFVNKGINIYERIQNVKEKLLKANIKKSGKNKFAGFDYYELADITPYIIKFCKEERLFTQITFGITEAVLTIRNLDNPSEYEMYTSPIEELELKGCNKMQALGGVETYSRRYLYLMAFDIIEADMFDAMDNTQVAPKPKKIVDTTNYKQKLMDKLKELNIDITNYAKEHQVNGKTTNEEAKALLEELCNK